MYTITHLPHTADLRLHLQADSLEELFAAGVEALQQQLQPAGCQGGGPYPLRHALQLQSVDTTVLLVDFLSEVLTLSHEEKAVFCVLEIQQLNETAIAAQIAGRPADGFAEDIKAVTYHEAEVRQNEAGKWETMLIFDI
jgi:SHS2 domain-containing protein